MMPDVAALARLAFDRADREFTVYLFSEDPSDRPTTDVAGAFDFNTKDEALSFASDPWVVIDEAKRLGLSAVGSGYWRHDVTHIGVQGPDHDETRKVSDGRRRPAPCKELAMEAGMLYGIEAYNDQMGY